MISMNSQVNALENKKKKKIFALTFYFFLFLLYLFLTSFNSPSAAKALFKFFELSCDDLLSLAIASILAI